MRATHTHIYEGPPRSTWLWLTNPTSEVDLVPPLQPGHEFVSAVNRLPASAATPEEKAHYADFVNTWGGFYAPTGAFGGTITYIITASRELVAQQSMEWVESQMSLSVVSLDAQLGLTRRMEKVDEKFSLHSKAFCHVTPNPGADDNDDIALCSQVLPRLSNWMATNVRSQPQLVYPRLLRITTLISNNTIRANVEAAIDKMMNSSMSS